MATPIEPNTFALKSKNHSDPSTFVNDQVHDEIMPCVKISYGSKPGDHEDSMLDQHYDEIQQKLTSSGTTGTRSFFYHLFNPDEKNIIQMDAFINDGGATTCIIGFSQKFDQAGASSLEWCNKYGPQYGLPTNLTKIADRGGFCMYHTHNHTDAAHHVVDYTCCIACDLLLFWYYNKKYATPPLPLVWPPSGPPEWYTRGQTTYTEIVGTHLVVGAGGGGAVHPNTITYIEFLERYKAIIETSPEGPARHAKISIIDLFVFNILWPKLNDICYQIVRNDTSRSSDNNAALIAPAPVPGISPLAPPPGIPPPVAVPPPQTAAEFARDCLDQVTFERIEYGKGEPDLYFSVPDGGGGGGGGGFDIFSNSQPTLAEKAKVHNNEYSSLVRGLVGREQHGLISPEARKKNKVVSAIKAVASVVNVLKKKKNPMDTSRECVGRIDRFAANHYAPIRGVAEPRKKSAALALVNTLPKLGGDTAHYLVGQEIKAALNDAGFTNKIIHCVQERPFFVRLMLLDVNLLMNAKRSIHLSTLFTVGANTQIEPKGLVYVETITIEKKYEELISTIDDIADTLKMSTEDIKRVILGDELVLPDIMMREVTEEDIQTIQTIFERVNPDDSEFKKLLAISEVRKQIAKFSSLPNLMIDVFRTTGRGAEVIWANLKTYKNFRNRIHVWKPFFTALESLNKFDYSDYSDNLKPIVRSVYADTNRVFDPIARLSSLDFTDTSKTISLDSLRGTVEKNTHDIVTVSQEALGKHAELTQSGGGYINQSGGMKGDGMDVEGGDDSAPSPSSLSRRTSMSVPIPNPGSPEAQTTEHTPGTGGGGGAHVPRAAGRTKFNAINESNKILQFGVKGFPIGRQNNEFMINLCIELTLQSLELAEGRIDQVSPNIFYTTLARFLVMTETQLITEWKRKSFSVTSRFVAEFNDNPKYFIVGCLFRSLVELPVLLACLYLLGLNTQDINIMRDDPSFYMLELPYFDYIRPEIIHSKYGDREAINEVVSAVLETIDFSSKYVSEVFEAIRVALEKFYISDFMERDIQSEVADAKAMGDDEVDIASIRDGVIRKLDSNPEVVNKIEKDAENLSDELTQILKDEYNRYARDHISLANMNGSHNPTSREANPFFGRCVVDIYGLYLVNEHDIFPVFDKLSHYSKVINLERDSPFPLAALVKTLLNITVPMEVILGYFSVNQIFVGQELGHLINYETELTEKKRQNTSPKRSRSAEPAESTELGVQQNIAPRSGSAMELSTLSIDSLEKMITELKPSYITYTDEQLSEKLRTLSPRQYRIRRLVDKKKETLLIQLLTEIGKISNNDEAEMVLQIISLFDDGTELFTTTQITEAEHIVGGRGRGREASLAPLTVKDMVSGVPDAQPGMNLDSSSSLGERTDRRLKRKAGGTKGASGGTKGASGGARKSVRRRKNMSGSKKKKQMSGGKYKKYSRKGLKSKKKRNTKTRKLRRRYKKNIKVI
jgi:hypothetical protein